MLHVEQEVLGDGTTALESLLSCDTERSALLKVGCLAPTGCKLTSCSGAAASR